MRRVLVCGGMYVHINIYIYRKLYIYIYIYICIHVSTPPVCCMMKEPTTYTDYGVQHCAAPHLTVQ
jgi:hypothetical protein